MLLSSCLAAGCGCCRTVSSKLLGGTEQSLSRCSVVFARVLGYVQIAGSVLAVGAGPSSCLVAGVMSSSGVPRNRVKLVVAGVEGLVRQAAWRPECLGKTSSLMTGALAVHGELGSSSVWSVL